MQKRYPHFLRRVVTEHFPSRIVAVECSHDDVPTRQDGSVVREKLAGWYASGGVLTPSGIGKVWNGRGCDVSSCWNAMRWAARQQGETWIVSNQAARAWSLIGLWALVESGELRLDIGEYGSQKNDNEHCSMPELQQSSGYINLGQFGPALRSMHGMPEGISDSPGRHTGNTEARRQAKGTCILQDPPSILACRFAELPGKLTILDVRNWGIELPWELVGTHDACRWILDTIARMVAILRSNRWGGLQTTVGGQSLHTFRRRYLNHAIECHAHTDALSLEGLAYYGGRCECRRLGQVKGTVYQYDYRSLYPSVCLSAKLPVMFDRLTDGAPASDARGEESLSLIIADVQIVSGEPAYPARRDYGTIWPGGTWRTQLAGPELIDAVKHDRVVHWYRHATYQGAPALDAFMRDAYAELERAREVGDKVISGWLKRLMLCCAGKFGQRGSAWVNSPGSIARAPWIQWVHCHPNGTTSRMRSIGWQCQEEIREPWAANSVPAIAAWITSAGRMRLLDAIRTAGWQNVLYHDTDSVFVTEEGSARLLSGGRVKESAIGSLRLVDRYSSAFFRGIKDYTVDCRTVRAGQPNSGNHNDREGGAYWFRERLCGAVSRGLRPEAIRQLRSYTRTARYKHGSVSDDGIVSPWLLEE